MIDRLDLLLDDRHALGEIVVIPDFARQVFDLVFHDRLRDFHFLARLVIGQQYGNDRADQGQAACDQRYKYGFGHFVTTYFLLSRGQVRVVRA